MLYCMLLVKIDELLRRQCTWYSIIYIFFLIDLRKPTYFPNYSTAVSYVASNSPKY
jgi:hypothetical protein